MKRAKRKLKIKWKNVSILTVGLLALSVIIHDVFMLTIYTWLTGNSYGWTWFGLITFVLACSVLGEVIEYFDDEDNQ